MPTREEIWRFLFQTLFLAHGFLSGLVVLGRPLEIWVAWPPGSSGGRLSIAPVDNNLRQLRPHTQRNLIIHLGRAG